MSGEEQIEVTTDFHFSMVPEWVFERLKLDTSALALYVFLSMKVYGNDGWSMSRQSIADALGWSLKTVDRKTKVLVEERVLRVHTTTTSYGEQGWNKYVVMRGGGVTRVARGRHQSRPGGVRNVAPVASPVSPLRIPKNVNRETKTTTTQRQKTTSSEKPQENAFAGSCVRCGGWVEAGAGSIAKDAQSRWSPVHLPGKCVGKAGKMLSSDYQNKNPEDWTTL